jgi:hypothetical protein
MRAWQHRWEAWAGWNLGLERWDLLLAQGKPSVFPEATMPCPILRQNFVDGSPPRCSEAKSGNN